MQSIFENKQTNPQDNLQNCLIKNNKKHITSNITNTSLFLGRETIYSQERENISVCSKGETTFPTTAEDSKKPV